MIENVSEQLVVLVPLVLVAVGFVAALVWWLNGGRMPRFVSPPSDDERRGHSAGAGAFVAWLALTGLTLWCGAMVAFVAVHALLFSLGTAAAWVGVIASGVFLAATPLAWGVLIRRYTRRISAHS